MEPAPPAGYNALTSQGRRGCTTRNALRDARAWQRIKSKHSRRVRQGARPEDGVSVLRGPDFQRILQREFHAQVSLGGTYYILHKLDFSSLMPRPQHP